MKNWLIQTVLTSKNFGSPLIKCLNLPWSSIVVSVDVFWNYRWDEFRHTYFIYFVLIFHQTFQVGLKVFRNDWLHWEAGEFISAWVLLRWATPLEGFRILLTFPILFILFAFFEFLDFNSSRKRLIEAIMWRVKWIVRLPKWLILQAVLNWRLVAYIG